MKPTIVRRQTNETAVAVRLKIAGQGRYEIATPIGFLNHLLELFARHGLFDLTVDARGDLQVDQHHTVEDIGITLGQAFDRALGDRRGIARAGYFAFPMHDALAVVAVDISGRANLQFRARFRHRRIGELESDLIPEFFAGFVQGLGADIHVLMPYGKNDHHRAESIFKAFARAMQTACCRQPRARGVLPSTKGRL